MVAPAGAVAMSTGSPTPLAELLLEPLATTPAPCTTWNAAVLVFTEGCVALWYCAVLLIVCGGRFALTMTWKVTLPEAPGATEGRIATTVAPAPSEER